MADIEWYYPEYGKGVGKSISDIVTHFPAVEGEIKRKANSMASEAWVTLNFHHKTGGAHIKVARHPRAKPRSPDWYVYLLDADPGGKTRREGGMKNKKDRSAMSIEFGWKTKNGTTVDGLNVLGAAMDRAVRRYGG